MFQHSNSRLTPRGRQRLVERVRAGESVSAVAREAGVSRQTAHKWIARAEAGEPLSDRRSRPSRLARLTPPDVEARVVGARRCVPSSRFEPAASLFSEPLRHDS